MIGSVVQCPRCELRYSFRTELEHHLREDHPQPEVTHEARPVKVDGVPARTSISVAAPVGTDAGTVERHGGWSAARLAGLLIAVAAVVLVAYVVVFLSYPPALIIAGAVLLTSGMYARRMRGRPRPPRR